MPNTTSRRPRMSMISQWILPLALALTAVPTIPAPLPVAGTAPAVSTVAEDAPRSRRRRPPVDEGCPVLPAEVEPVSAAATSCTLAPGPTP